MRLTILTTIKLKMMLLNTLSKLTILVNFLTNAEKTCEHKFPFNSLIMSFFHPNFVSFRHKILSSKYWLRLNYTFYFQLFLSHFHRPFHPHLSSPLPFLSIPYLPFLSPPFAIHPPFQYLRTTFPANQRSRCFGKQK